MQIDADRVLTPWANLALAASCLAGSSLVPPTATQHSTSTDQTRPEARSLKPKRCNVTMMKLWILDALRPTRFLCSALGRTPRTLHTQLSVPFCILHLSFACFANGSVGVSFARFLSCGSRPDGNTRPACHSLFVSLCRQGYSLLRANCPLHGVPARCKQGKATACILLG
jgi:hypothetical protein